MSAPRRPTGPRRTESASSFADAFSVARRKVNQDIAALEESHDSDNSESIASPGLTSDSDSGTPTSPASPLSGPITPIPDNSVADDFAFAFDIDGVLIRGGKVIPEAIEAMRMLNGENEYGISM